MRATGVRIDEIVGGGAVRSPLWLQIHADTAELPVSVTRFPEAPVLGSALLAALGIGAFPDIDAAIRSMVSVDR
jgi:ribulose kinase